MGGGEGEEVIVAENGVVILRAFISLLRYLEIFSNLKCESLSPFDYCNHTAGIDNRTVNMYYKNI
jgi:hypothetical protein